MNKIKIIRFFFDENVSKRTIKKGLTEEEAMLHCNDPETSSSTCTSSAGKRRTKNQGKWFDGFTEEGAWENKLEYHQKFMPK